MIAELRADRRELVRCLGCLMRAYSHSRRPELNPVPSSRSACDGLRFAILVIEPSMLARKFPRQCYGSAKRFLDTDFKDCDAGEDWATGCVRTRFFRLTTLWKLKHSRIRNLLHTVRVFHYYVVRAGGLVVN